MLPWWLSWESKTWNTDCLRYKFCQQCPASNCQEIATRTPDNEVVYPTTRSLKNSLSEKEPRCQMITSFEKLLVVGWEASLYPFLSCSLTKTTLSGDLVIGGTTVQ
jgi:hypothetical protein